jgi:hypothetical protein
MLGAWTVGQTAGQALAAAGERPRAAQAGVVEAEGLVVRKRLLAGHRACLVATATFQ